MHSAFSSSRLSQYHPKCLLFSFMLSIFYVFLNLVHVYLLSDHLLCTALVHLYSLLLLLKLDLQQQNLVPHYLNVILYLFELLSLFRRWRWVWQFRWLLCFLFRNNGLGFFYFLLLFLLNLLLLFILWIRNNIQLLFRRFGPHLKNNKINSLFKSE